MGILTPSNENANRAVKLLKGQKKVLETVQHNKHKDLLLKNENVLKFFVYDQLVKEKKAQSLAQSSDGERSPSSKTFQRVPTRHETTGMVSFKTKVWISSYRHL